MRRRASPLRPVLVGVLLAALLLVGAVLWPTGRSPSSGSDASGPAPAADDRTAALAVLRAWDRERAAAWRTGDAAALGRLYVPGSPAGRADRTMLRSYAERGLRVTGLRMQVASAEVRYADDDRIALVVTERLAASATASGPGGDLALPGDGWSRRRVVLVGAEGRWRVASVVGQRSPAASTSSTSVSENS